jgi:hypothetical protein
MTGSSEEGDKYRIIRNSDKYALGQLLLLDEKEFLYDGYKFTTQ